MGWENFEAHKPSPKETHCRSWLWWSTTKDWSLKSFSPGSSRWNRIRDQRWWMWWVWRFQIGGLSWVSDRWVFDHGSLWFCVWFQKIRKSCWRWIVWLLLKMDWWVCVCILTDVWVCVCLFLFFMLFLFIYLFMFGWQERFVARFVFVYLLEIGLCLCLCFVDKKG